MARRGGEACIARVRGVGKEGEGALREENKQVLDNDIKVNT